MSRGFGADAVLEMQDDKIAVYRYGNYNLNLEEFRNPEMTEHGSYEGGCVVYINDIPKAEAEKCIRLLKELHPDCPVSIVGEDRNLYLLGFADDIPCRLEVNFTFDEAEMLYEEVMQMEVDAYNEDDRIIYSPYSKLTEEEKRRKRIIDEYQNRYNHFACLEPFLFYLMDYLE